MVHYHSADTSQTHSAIHQSDHTNDQNYKGYTVGISELGNKDTIAPAVYKGNDTLLDWVNEEIKSLGDEQFFHKDYEETLVDTYGKDYEEDLVVEGGAVK